MKILIVHEVSYMKKPVYEYQDFPERLSSQGHDVTVVDFDQYDDGKPIDQIVSRTGLAKIRLRRPGFSTIPLWKYISALISYKLFIEKILKTENFDAILVYSIFINGWTTVRAANQGNTSLAFRALDAYHLLHANKLAQKILLLGEKYIYKNASKILVTNEEMAIYVKKIAQSNLKNDPLVLNHGVDTDVFFPYPADEEITKRYKIQADEIVIAFLGTTYGFSGLDEITQRMPSLLAKNPKIRLLIIGGGELDDKLKNIVIGNKLEDKVILTGMIDYQFVPQHLSVAHLTINPFQINAITENIVPIKILQYLSCAKPLLCTPLRDVMKKFPEGISGIRYTKTDDINEFCEAMLEMAADTWKLQALSSSAREYILENNSIDQTIKKLIKVF